eukprot:scaffold2842_cov373-Prasinococcus_capsulatus_cf.AAC.6
MQALAGRVRLPHPTAPPLLPRPSPARPHGGPYRRAAAAAAAAPARRACAHHRRDHHVDGRPDDATAGGCGGTQQGGRAAAKLFTPETSQNTPKKQILNSLSDIF